MKDIVPEAPDSTALRAFVVLEHLVRAEGPVSLDEVTQAVRLPKPTVYRILGMLQRNGFLQREPASKRYAVGARLASFALDVLSSASLRAKRREILRKLVAQIGETCNFTMLDGGEVLYLDRVETSASVRLHLEPGVRLPLHCTASGKLFLSQLPEDEVREVLGEEPYQAYTDNTITDYPSLEKALKRVRATGVGIDQCEYDRDSVCIAVPVEDPHGRICAALAVHAPSSRMTVQKGLEYVPALQRAAQHLAETLAPRGAAGETAPAASRKKVQPSTAKTARTTTASPASKTVRKIAQRAKSVA